MNHESYARQEVLNSVRKFYHTVYDKKSDFKVGMRVPYAGRVFDELELVKLVDASLDFWLTSGRYTKCFEKKFEKFLGIQNCLLTNSGSSANLLAFMALTSAELGNKRIKPGDEIITVAAGFPTTVAPIIQYGAVPVFLDITLPEYNIDVTRLESALSKKTKAVFLAHTLGNPFDLTVVRKICDAYHLWLIEDNCDALGTKYLYDGIWRYTGTFGDIATSSFYPPHHITMGEGGAVYTNNVLLNKIVRSFRDWGRDCWCDAGRDNTCGNRFSQKFGELPFGYDHKYVYSHFGYNLKLTDMQAAIGCAQIEKLPDFINKRKENWDILKQGLSHLKDVFILPEKRSGTDPSWFGFLITVRPEADFTRDDIVAYLESKNIQTRMLFAGNLLKHPCFDEMRNQCSGYRIIGTLSNTDIVMNQSFWIGVYPGMTRTMLEYMIDSIDTYVKDFG